MSVAREKALDSMNLMQADACALPFAEGQVDYFISTLFLHHLSPEQVIGVLRETYHRSRRGIVMSDLVRSYLPLLAFRLIQPIFARHYLTRHDGSLSIRRAYTPYELRAFARTAGLETARVYQHFPWRMTLSRRNPVFDVAIIGGGLAGCNAAITLARRNRRVLLLEANPYPHPKVCGEFLSPECISLFAESGLSSGAATVKPGDD